jgi:hypothetical protein
MVDTTELLEPVIDPGSARVNYFNGRLLSAEDLTRDQQASRRMNQSLGRALGSGVAYGLVVTDASTSVGGPALAVSPGSAINLHGTTLEVGASIPPVALVRPAPDTGSSDPSGFGDCQPPGDGTYLAGAGVYVFAVGPASEGIGRAVANGLPGSPSTCQVDGYAEGVQFRLAQIRLPDDRWLEQPALRNLVAHMMFGTTDPSRWSFQTDPFGMSSNDRYGLDGLYANCLRDDEVPLALIEWTATHGLVFVDRWSVRRPLVAPSAASRWPSLFGQRTTAEGQAMLLQFEEQLDDLLADGADHTSDTAAQYFGYLPPAGVLPVSDVGSPSGFIAPTFFGLQSSTDIHVTEGALVEPLLRSSFGHEPIDVGSDAQVRLYYVSENLAAVAAGVSQQLAVVYAATTLPYIGVARFGRAVVGADRFRDESL